LDLPEDPPKGSQAQIGGFGGVHFGPILGHFWTHLDPILTLFWTSPRTPKGLSGPNRVI